MKRISAILTFFLLLAKVITSPTYAENMALPSFGNAASGTVSLSKEHQIGQIFLQQLYRQAKILNDPVIQDYLESLIYKLAAVSSLPDKRLTVVLINNPALNAFAAPGGIIGVNTGLLFYANNEQELAAVLAHELAHLSQRHFSRDVQDANNSRLPTMAGLLGGILLTSLGGGSVGMAAIASTMAGSISHQLSFSRQQEAEADRIGIKTLYLAGMDPYAMPEMFQRLQHLQNSNGGQPLEFLQTHPITLNRIADTQGRAAQYPKRTYKMNSLAFELAQMRIRVYSTSQLQTLISTLQADLNTKKSHDYDATHYGLAFAFYKTKSYQSAKKQLQPLLKRHPENLYYQLLDHRILFASGNKQAALKDSLQLMNNTPGNIPATMLYARFLYRTAHYEKCRSILRALLEQHPKDPFIWKLLKDATGKAGNIIEYYMDNSRYLHLTGKTGQAIEQLQYALNSQRMTYAQRQSMQQQLIHLQKDKKMAEDLSI